VLHPTLAGRYFVEIISQQGEIPFYILLTTINYKLITIQHVSSSAKIHG